MTITGEANEQAIQLSADLNISRIEAHFGFLKTLHDEGVTKNPGPESLRRYLLWLSLLVHFRSHNKLTANLVPPSDIAWLWHCHRLSPQKYQEYLQSILLNAAPGDKQLLDWKDPSGDPYRLEPGHTTTLEAWKALHPEEPFELDANALVTSMRTTSQASETLAGLDLLASAKRQAELYWQLMPYFLPKGNEMKPTFDAAKALLGYQRFLLLMKKHPKEVLVPTYLIDLYWHTHMTAGSIYDYHSDCERIVGRLIDHDDDYGQGDRDGELGQGFTRTAKLWKEAYNDDDTYAKGGGYRGSPPADYFPAPWVVATNVTAVPEEAPAKMESDLSPATNDSTKKHCISPKLCLSIGCLAVLGGTLLALGFTAFRPVQYACEGQAPTRAELEARLAASPNASAVPVCLTTSVWDEVMCLQAGLAPEDPPVHCNTNPVTSFTVDTEFVDWFLYWSGCTTCGPAWRMYDAPLESVSRYKLPTTTDSSSSSSPTTPPLGIQVWLEWRYWDYYNQQWFEERVTINQCMDSSEDSNGIPLACFVESENIGLITGGVFITFASAFIFACFLCCQNAQCSSGGGTRTRSRKLMGARRTWALEDFLLSDL